MPIAELVEAGSDTFIGTTFTGGVPSVGTVFQLNLAGSPAPTTQRLLNISTRATVRTGDQITIGGFIITGSEPTKVLLRGIGPSLNSIGLTTVLADPMVQLIDQSGTAIQTNDNWKETQQSGIEATGAAPTSDLESALIATLPPGAYTALLQDTTDETGIGLVEVYDLGNAASRLANLSTRAFVDIGDNVLIGGTILGGLEGTGPTNVVVRALGPSLGGVNGTLLDPTFELHDADGALVASNDNWRDTQEAEIEAAGLAPTDDRRIGDQDIARRR